jgi:hypothetical protein
MSSSTTSMKLMKRKLKMAEERRRKRMKRM